MGQKFIFRVSLSNGWVSSATIGVVSNGAQPAGFVLRVGIVEGLVLKAISDKLSMANVDGFCVHQGQAPKGFDWSRVVNADREERSRSLAGL
jgi:hypothetical protein